jgi:N-methylhydantoinase B
MATSGSNAETVESRVPALQVYRRELQDAGGPGRYRGGVAVEFATVPHKLPVRPAGLNNISSGVAVPAGRGLSGGAPGAAAGSVVLRRSNIRELFASGRLPGSHDEVSSEEVDVVPAKSFTAIDEGDFLVGLLPGGAGYGDPLRREPASTVADVRDGLVSEEAALSVFGVVVHDGELDEAATTQAREDARRERRAQSRPVADRRDDAVVEGGVVLHPISDAVEAVELEDGTRALRCTVCQHRLGGYEDDHKRATLVRERPLRELGPHNRRCAESFVVREFFCPGCLTSVAMDIQDAGEPILDESALRGADVRE